MPRSARKKSMSGIYHVVFRGINRQRIFEDEEDYQKYLRIINTYRNQCGFSLYAWCLMPNHIHLLMKEGKVPLENVFRRVGSRFVYWYNSKYDRVGHLFQDRFRSEAVEDESYFLTVIRYIHLNPVKAGLCKAPGSWEYSSYPYYFNNDKYAENELIFQMIGKSEFERFHQEKNDDICLDFDHPAKHRITDEQAAGIAEREACCERISMLQSMPIEEQRRVIQILLKKGASIRQINRLSGISIGIIQKIKDDM